MKLLGLEHLDLVVEDIGASVEFYRKLGLYPEGTLEDGGCVFLFNGDEENPVRVELHQAEPGGKTGVDHISFRVDDPVAANREGRFLGIEFLFEPNENALSGRTITNCLDPDGVQIQLSKKTAAGAYGNWE